MATDNEVFRRDVSTGKAQGSNVTIDDNGSPNIPAGQTYNIDGSPHTHEGSGLTQSETNISPTTANVTAAVTDDVNYHFADISGLTADRNFVFPAGTVGQIIGLKLTTGDADYELVLIGDTGIDVGGAGAATEYKKAKRTGESFLFIANSTSSWEEIATVERAIELDYVEITSAVFPTATVEASADVVVTGSAVNYDGSTPVVIEFFSNWVSPDTAAAGRNVSFYLFEDGSSLGRIGRVQTPAAALAIWPVHLQRRITPSAGSHTYSIRATVSAGTGTISAGAGGSGAAVPSYVRITRANP